MGQGACPLRFFWYLFLATRKVHKNFPLRARCAKGKKKQLFVFKEAVDLGEELVAINTVNSASFFNGFAAGSRAAEAVHTDLKEEGSGFGSDIENIADDCLSGDFHNNNHAFHIFY